MLRAELVLGGYPCQSFLYACRTDCQLRFAAVQATCWDRRSEIRQVLLRILGEPNFRELEPERLAFKNRGTASRCRVVRG
jgi:hypothetical protein